ncbi:FMN-binding negative transcriptional regulator [Salinicola rhizosphaerae]|uniref:Transcriptional regulator n=1 Tax=Salinicola rhizosphaerae TaxID=1443141 RepID=A0ABQ3E5D0_9GAMM|nr:FMN-binding negative transcriptional regulator [Salinicola rhizosphaerae]GHB21626.1 transcriptional regulator [Salinicola rhizosphaerae]
MYHPGQFRLGDTEEIRKLIERFPFANLITQSATGEIQADHLPLVPAPAWASGNQTLWGHIARANPLAADTDERPAMAIFHGAQTYITPSWYPAKREHGKVVPTWNYEIVHVRGRLRLIDDPAWLQRAVGHLTDRFESERDMPWSIDDAPADFIGKLCHAIVGLELTIERVEGKRKASQHKSLEERESIRRGLVDERGFDAMKAARLSGMDRDSSSATDEQCPTSSDREGL